MSQLHLAAVAAVDQSQWLENVMAATVALAVPADPLLGKCSHRRSLLVSSVIPRLPSLVFLLM
jgi:hypothetical protein